MLDEDVPEIRIYQAQDYSLIDAEIPTATVLKREFHRAFGICTIHFVAFIRSSRIFPIESDGRLVWVAVIIRPHGDQGHSRLNRLHMRLIVVSFVARIIEK